MQLGLDDASLALGILAMPRRRGSARMTLPAIHTIGTVTARGHATTAPVLALNPRGRAPRIDGLVIPLLLVGSTSDGPPTTDGTSTTATPTMPRTSTAGPDGETSVTATGAGARTVVMVVDGAAGVGLGVRRRAVVGNQDVLQVRRLGLSSPVNSIISTLVRISVFMARIYISPASLAFHHRLLFDLERTEPEAMLPTGPRASPGATAR